MWKNNYGSAHQRHQLCDDGGGGLDIDVGHGISIRPVQAEYLLRRYSAIVPAGGTQLVNWVTYNNDFRYSAGVTFRFGSIVGKGR